MNGLRSMLLVAALMAGGACFAADPPRVAVVLRGIVNAPKFKCAVLEFSPRPGALPVERILRERERLDDVEVVKIEPRTGEVTIRRAGEEELLTLPREANETKSNLNTLDLRAAKLESVLDLYQNFAGRTVLHSPFLASFRLMVRTGPVPVTEAVTALDKSLADSGVIMAPHGEKFVIALPARDAAKLDALPAPPEPIAASGDLIPPGVIKFAEADIAPVLDIYQDLAGRTLLRPASLPALKITVKSQTELTQSEAIHMLDVLFALGGLTTLRDGDKFVFVVPEREVPRLAAITALRPPERPQAAPAAGRTEAAEHAGPADNLKFQQAPVPAVLQVYADLAGRKALPIEAGFPNVRLSISSQTPLTRSEALYALQAVAVLNHVQFAFVGDKEVKAVFMPTMERNAPPDRAK